MFSDGLTRNAATALALGLSCLCWGTPAVSATVYKCLDENGRVAYSDTPCPGGVRMEIPTEVLVPAPAAPQKPGAAETDQGGPGAGTAAFAGYSGLAVQNPANEEALRDNSGEGTVPVLLSVSPALRADLGHEITVYLDGAAWPERFSSPQFYLEGVGPGTHTLRVAVVGRDGSELFSSATSKFSLLRVTKLTPKMRPEQPAPAEPPKPPSKAPFTAPKTLPPLPAK